jgi:energy-coupling factor transporter ATP-binding protein EcfA2
MVEGSGFLQWLSVFALATTPEIDVLLLDEPDAHLHTSLQDQLLESLRSVGSVSEKQILVATHSSEILRSADAQDILHLRSGGRGGKYLAEDTHKVGLLAGLGSDYAPRIDQAKRTKRILFVEGRTDVPILKTLSDTLGTDWPDEWTIWITSVPQKERKQLYLALKEEIPDLVVLSLRDRDDEPAETVGADLVDHTSPADANFHPRRWRRRYIESYVIWPPAIASATGLDVAVVRQELTDHHGLSVGAHFTDSDPPQALLDVRAKQILRPSGGMAVMGQFDASALDVAKHLDIGAIPEDVKTFLDEVASLA